MGELFLEFPFVLSSTFCMYLATLSLNKATILIFLGPRFDLYTFPCYHFYPLSSGCSDSCKWTTKRAKKSPTIQNAACKLKLELLLFLALKKQNLIQATKSTDINSENPASWVVHRQTSWYDIIATFQLYPFLMGCLSSLQKLIMKLAERLGWRCSLLQ